MTKLFRKSNSKAKRGWVFFDWANSAYSLVITSTIFPAVFEALVTDPSIMGFNFSSSQTLYVATISCSYLIIMSLTPVLASLADYSGRKLFFLKLFSSIGATACAALYFFSQEHLLFGLLAVVLASIGFSGSLVFYNAYLPEIAEKEEQDALSAKGYAYGYVGSSLLLVALFVLAEQPLWIGLESGLEVYRVGFVLVGVWWLLFSRGAFLHLPKDKAEQFPKVKQLFKGAYRELFQVWKTLKQDKSMLQFLRAFFMADLALQTLIIIAPFFALNAIGMEPGELIVVVLIMQIVGVIGAHFFAWLSERKGNVVSLISALVLYTLICLAAVVIEEKSLFYALGGAMGFALAGVQSLSRSSYSKLLPDLEHTSTYFSFYDFTEKLSILLGTLINIGALLTVSSMSEAVQARTSIGILAVFFMIAIFLFLPLMKEKKLK